MGRTEEWDEELDGAWDHDSITTGAGMAVLSMLPLFLAYELALLARPASTRNAGELVLGMSLAPLGEYATYARWGLVLLASAAALWRVRSQEARAAEGVSRIVLEGLGFAVVIGPVLVLATRLLSGWVEPLAVSWDPVATRAADGIGAAVLFGGSAWEELVFRMGSYSFLYWLGLRSLQALDAPERLGRAVGEVVGLLGSSAFFAAAHIEPLAGPLGGRGAAFDPSLFVWLLSAGVALGLLFRLRGPGIAAWAHGLFNVGLWIGIDPEVLL